MKLMLMADKQDPEIARYTAQMFWYEPGSTEFYLVRLGSIIGFFTFGNYTAIGLCFAAFSFSGMWALYMTLAKIRPQVYKELAWSLFYVPSLFFWGSGLLKDSVCLGALGWLFYGFYRGAIEKKSLARSLTIAFAAAYLLFRIKVYILLCFLPPALLWLFNENSSRIKNGTLRMLVKPVFFAIGAAVAFYAATNLTKGDERFDVDKIGERSKITADYLYEVSVKQEGAGYYLGKQDGSIASMVKLAPQAIIVALYRPFLWEARNPVMLLSAIEATFFLFFTLRIFWRTGVLRTLRLISSTPILSLCFVFSLIFAASVGISSSNFGTLVRYKIPFIPFYLGGLYILQSLSVPQARPVRRRIQVAKVA